MKRTIVIGSISIVILLGIVAGIFMLRPAPADTAHKGPPATKSTTPVSSPTADWSFAPHPVGTASPAVTVTPATNSTPTPVPTAGATVHATPPTVSPSPTRATVPPTSVPATPTSSGASSGTLQLAQKLFQQINSDRAAEGLSPYTWDDKIAAVSTTHSKTMGQGCGLSHQCSGEPAPCDRLTNAGVSWMACGENAGYTSPTPDQWSAVKASIEQGMLGEQPPNDGHRRNLLSTSYHRVGIGVYIDAKGLIWVTEDFTN
jgi:uncharacterized protein YkwD